MPVDGQREAAAQHSPDVEDALLPRLFDRIVEATGAGSLGDRAGDLVLAAYQGDAELADEIAATGEREGRAARGSAVCDVPRTYLKSVTVAGFRGIGPERTLRLQPGPGLTLVVGHLPEATTLPTKYER